MIVTHVYTAHNYWTVSGFLVANFFFIMKENFQLNIRFFFVLTVYLYPWLALIIQAVIKRLMTDVPFGVLLSGGLDSSLVAAIASRHLGQTKVARQWGSQLHTFCIGLKVIIQY